MQRVRFEHEFQAALLDADSAWRDLCEFVSFRTIVRELTLRARMKGLSIQLFSPPARKLRQLAHHYHPGLGDAAAEFSQRTSSVPQWAMQTYALLQRRKPLRAI